LKRTFHRPIRLDAERAHRVKGFGRGHFSMPA